MKTIKVYLPQVEGNKCIICKVMRIGHKEYDPVSHFTIIYNGEIITFREVFPENWARNLAKQNGFLDAYDTSIIWGAVEHILIV